MARGLALVYWLRVHATGAPRNRHPFMAEEGVPPGSDEMFADFEDPAVASDPFYEVMDYMEEDV